MVIASRTRAVERQRTLDREASSCLTTCTHCRVRETPGLDRLGYPQKRSTSAHADVITTIIPSDLGWMTDASNRGRR